MTKLIIQHLWSDFKKHWLGILVTLVLCYIATIFVFTFGFWFFMVDSEAYLLSEAELRKMILNGSETYTLLYFIGTAGILLSVILISRKFPVRLLKPIYFCPADMRLKRKSLRSYLGSKVSFCLILFVLLCLSFTGNLLIFFQSYLQTSWSSWIIALWIIAMIGNVFAAAYCIRTFLNNMISYENLYFPKQEVTVC